MSDTAGAIALPGTVSIESKLHMPGAIPEFQRELLVWTSAERLCQARMAGDWTW